MCGLVCICKMHFKCINISKIRIPDFCSDVTLNAAHCHLQHAPTHCFTLQQYHWNAIQPCAVSKIIRHRDRYPPPLRQRMDMFLVIMYQVYSNLTAVLCTGNITKTLFAHKEQSTTDFRSSQYSSSHILHFLFSRGRQALHILYSMLTYYNNI